MRTVTSKHRAGEQRPRGAERGGGLIGTFVRFHASLPAVSHSPVERLLWTGGFPYSETNLHGHAMSDDFLKRHGGGCEPAADVPVFDCHVILSGPDEAGKYSARAANLRGATGGGTTERQALLSVTTAFKAIVADHYRNGESIPWVDPPETPRDGEVERWIPVHL